MKQISVLAAILLTAALCPTAQAEPLVMPENLTEIGGYAFAGDETITEVVLGKSVVSIGGGAFSGCENLAQVVVNNRGSAAVGEGAFPKGIAFYAANGAIASYAGQGGYFKGFQALLVGQTYPHTEKELPGCDQDAESLSELLGRQGLTAYDPIKVRLNLTYASVQAELEQLAETATEKSTTLFYYSGHGGRGGTLVFPDENGNLANMEPAALRTLLDGIPGQKIVIVDACHSGGLIGRGEGESAQEFVDRFLSAFSGGVSSRSDNAFLNDEEEYAVLAACRETQQSVSFPYSDEGYFGLFTGVLECAAENDTGRMDMWYAYYPETRVKNMEYPDAAPGDKNGDGLLTLSEAYDYVEEAVRHFSEKWNSELAETPDEIIDQTVQVWPEDSGFVLFGR